jgi:hypothetical protein
LNSRARNSESPEDELVILKVMVLATLMSVALLQMGLAIRCLRRSNRGRLAACALLLTAPLQVVSAVWSRSFLASTHTPSSFDAPADGFEILVHSFALTGSLVVLSILLGICVVGTMLFARNTEINRGLERPLHQPETESGALLVEFTSEALAPDDPRLEPRIRRGRPADRKRDPRYDASPETEQG